MEDAAHCCVLQVNDGCPGRVRHLGSANHLRPQVEGTWDLDQVKRRGVSRTSADAGHIDLGNEPPLSVDGQSGNLVDRRRVSVQWFSGTILTGLCGAALMGGAVFAALDGEANFATVPERVEAAMRGAAGNVADRWSNATRKSRPAADRRAKPTRRARSSA